MAENTAVAGWRTNPDTGEYLDEEKEEEERRRRSLLAREEEGPSPLAMGLLQLGASMMRDEGWRDRPITLGESIGKAIPHGIAGYFDQDIYNRQRRNELLQERQLAEDEEEADLAAKEAERQKVERYKAFSKNLDLMPDDALAIGGSPERASHRRENLKQLFLKNPEEAMKKLEDIWKKHEEIANRVPAKKSGTELASEKKSALVEKIRPGIHEKLWQLEQEDSVPDHVKRKMQNLYSDPEILTEDDLIRFKTDWAEAMGSKKDRDYTNERTKLYEYLKGKNIYETLSPDEKRIVDASPFKEDPKEGLDMLQKMLEASEYQADWQLKETIPKYDQEGNVKTTTKIYENRVTGKTYKEVERGALGTVKIESMTGAAIIAKYPKWKDMNFDPNKLYNIETNLSGAVSFSGTILDLNEKEPGKAQEYADNMLMSAVNMGLISQTDAFEMEDWEPDSVIRNLNTLFIQDREKVPAGDTNAGSIKSGTEINLELDPTGKKKVFKEDGNFYWDGTTWKDIDEGDAQTIFANEQKLRSEFDKNTKKFGASTFAYNSIVAGYNNSLKDPKSAGVNDIMIVRAFLLMIEPNSVVRESEFGTAAKSQGMMQYTKNLISKMKDGAILTQASRRRFFNAAMGYMRAVKSGYKIQMDRYKKIAKHHGIDPKNVVVDIFKDRPELEIGGKYEYQPYIMKDKDWMLLKNTHKELVPPKGKEGIEKRNSKLPKLKF